MVLVLKGKNQDGYDLGIFEVPICWLHRLTSFYELSDGPTSDKCTKPTSSSECHMHADNFAPYIVAQLLTRAAFGWCCQAATHRKLCGLSLALSRGLFKDNRLSAMPRSQAAESNPVHPMP